MPPAARVGDATTHPGVLSPPGMPLVLIEGMPAARVGDLHACAFPGTPPHPPNVVAKGSASVFIAGMPAARIGDACACGATITTGAPTVLIGG